MRRTTGRKESVKAVVECIAYQINDVLQAMKKDSGIDVQTLCVDGGPTRNRYLMQFQSNISNVTVKVPNVEELSGIGAAYMAEIVVGLFTEKKAFINLQYVEYHSDIDNARRKRICDGWKKAISKVIN